VCKDQRENLQSSIYIYIIVDCPSATWGCHGRDRKVVGFTTTCVISA